MIQSKFTIAPFRKPIEVVPNLEGCYKQLQELLPDAQTVPKHQRINYEELYRTSEKISLFPTQRAEVIRNYRAMLKSHISDNLKSITDLQGILRFYQLFKSKVEILKNCLVSLDFKLKDDSLEQFKELFCDISKPWVLSGLLERIGKQRDLAMPEAIDNDDMETEVSDTEVLFLREIVKMFMDLGIYYSIFEKEFMVATKKYYKDESAKVFKSAEPLAFLNHVDKRIAYESATCLSIAQKALDDTEVSEGGYLDMGTKNLLISILEQEFIHAYAREFVPKFFNEFIAKKEYAHIQKLYEFLSRTKDLDILKDHINTHVTDSAASILANTTELELIAKLLELQAEMKTIVQDHCDDDVDLSTQVKDSLKAALHNKTKPAELMAMFIDRQMKAKKSEKEVVNVLDGCLSLFRLIEGKDVFEAFYGKCLGKRLLLDKSSSVDLEKRMLSKLKDECGSGFTNKLEGMFRDMEKSKDIMRAFEESEKHQVQLGQVEFLVNVLTSGFWPTYASNEIQLPETGNKDLILSLYQAIVLLLFNNNNSLKTSEIQSLTLLEPQDLHRTLLSISLGKAKILNKQPGGKNVRETDVWSINEQFTHPQRRIVVNQIQAMETEKEIKQTTERVFEDRQYEVDALIVRLMKAEKRCRFKVLIGKVLENLRFSVEIADLKKRIESLVERDYLERDPSDHSVYVYLA